MSGTSEHDAEWMARVGAVAEWDHGGFATA
jgi:hypothetical protein